MSWHPGSLLAISTLVVDVDRTFEERRHESPTTTRIYLHADMALKEQAIARTAPPDTSPARYQADDKLLAFLDQL